MRASFFDQDVRQILNILLASYEFEDRCRWFPKENREYTIRSGYRLLLRGSPKSDEDIYNDIGQDIRIFYNILWEANVPEKMKTTCWRYLNNFIPIKFNLFQRRIGLDRMCPRCGGG